MFISLRASARCVVARSTWRACVSRCACAGAVTTVFGVGGAAESLRQKLRLARLERGEVGFGEQRTDVGIGEHFLVEAIDDRRDIGFSTELGVNGIGTANRGCFNGHDNFSPSLRRGARVRLHLKFVACGRTGARGSCFGSRMQRVHFGDVDGFFGVENQQQTVWKLVHAQNQFARDALERFGRALEGFFLHFEHVADFVDEAG